MKRKRGARLAAALALALVLCGPMTAFGAGRAGGDPGGAWSWPGWGGAWAWLRGALTAAATAQIDCDQGSQIDPDGRDGRCGTGLTAVPGGQGSEADADQGIHIDPDG